MEILNSVWSALSTENEVLVDIITAFLTIIELSLFTFIFTSILNIKIDKKHLFAYIFISYLVSIITYLFIPNPYNLLVNYMIYFILIKFIFKTNFLKTLIAIVLPIIISSLLVIMFSNPFIKVFGISTESIQLIPIYKIGFSLLTYFFILVIILVLRHKNIKIILSNNINKNIKRIFIGNFIFGISIICVHFTLINYYLDALPILYSCLSFLSLLAYFALSIYSLTKVLKLEATTQELKNAEEYNKTLQILHDNVRCFKHDFDNIVTTIGGYIATDDMDGLKKYYSELEKDCKRVNNLYILNPKIVNNPGVYSLLVNKYKKAQELNINMTIEFILNLEELNVDIYQFTRMLGILLDNAIEAAKDSKEKIINVIFRAEDTRHRKVVIIENSYSNKDVDINEIFNKGTTEKENHTGLGLYKVKKILSKNNNLNLFTTKSKKYFKQQLEIY